MSERDRLEAAAYERRRLLAALLGERAAKARPWRPLTWGALAACLQILVEVGFRALR